MQRIALGFIKVYQLVLSPWVGNQCRYVPTCSEYTKEAIEKYGTLKGTWMGMKRIGRCHPYSKHDPFDPVR